MPPQLREMSAELLSRLAGWSAPVIAGMAVLHFFAFLWLAAWARRDLRRMATDFDSFTRELKHRSLLDTGISLSDQIDAFLADVKEVLDDPTKKAERLSLTHRVKTLDEQRRYLQYRDLAVEGSDIAGVRVAPLLLIAFLLIAAELLLAQTRWRMLP